MKQWDPQLYGGVPMPSFMHGSTPYVDGSAPYIAEGWLVLFHRTDTVFNNHVMAPTTLGGPG